MWLKSSMRTEKINRKLSKLITKRNVESLASLSYQTPLFHKPQKLFHLLASSIIDCRFTVNPPADAIPIWPFHFTQTHTHTHSTSDGPSRVTIFSSLYSIIISTNKLSLRMFGCVGWRCSSEISTCASCTVRVPPAKMRLSTTPDRHTFIGYGWLSFSIASYK